ncbi:MAG TPA: RHS repeat-associated core domain-containing protein [Clostridiales bacterium]|nr:RHS repeat-associated core domain-containing protein [Clostridiales bacterium]
MVQDGIETAYAYDALGQLIRVDDGQENATWLYTYDNGGNIRSKQKFALGVTTGEPLESKHFSYSNAAWRDQLTAVDGVAITYDAIGTPLSDGTWSYAWQNGRQLQKMQKQGETVEFVYNENGLRVQKTATSTGVTKYTLHGKNVVHMTRASDELHFFYDAQNKPAVVVFNGTAYAYLYNQQDDVIGLLDSNGTHMVSYTYDAWGKPISKTGTLASTLGTINPFRYRGYVYDEEAGFYYASSRYYDPEISRFINADDTEYLGADGSVLSYNLFAYCMNDPVNRFDVDGNWSLPNWAKIAIGAAAIAVGVIATVATGGAAVPVLVASLKIAATSAAIGAVSGAGISAVNHRVSTGSWEGAGKAAVTGAIDGACDGFMWGGITAGASFTTVAAKGIKVKEIGKLKPSNKPGDGYSGVKYQAPKANGKYTTKSIELHSPHKSGPHDVWHWQQNTWNPYNNSITGSAKHWTIWGKPL